MFAIEIAVNNAVVTCITEQKRRVMVTDGAGGNPRGMRDKVQITSLLVIASDQEIESITGPISEMGNLTHDLLLLLEYS